MPIALTFSLLVTLSAAPRASGHRFGAPAASAFASDAEIHALIKSRVDDKRSAGLVVGVLDADGTRRVVAYGDAGPGRPALDGDSVFEIGSVSKVFTATALAVLIQDGVVKLDDPVQKYLPTSVHVPARNGKAITLANLSEQNSGLPPLPTNLHPKNPSNPYANYSVADLYAFLSSYTLTRDPGAEFEYSNLGVGLLGDVLALAARTTYEDLERDRVWRPLGMAHTAIMLTPWMVEHLVRGHDEAGQVVSNWDFPAFAGAGAIRSTATDMLTFVDANLHPERGPLQRAMAFAQAPRAPADAGETIGLNWLIDRPGKVAVTWHNGGTGGYRHVRRARSVEEDRCGRAVKYRWRGQRR